MQKFRDLQSRRWEVDVNPGSAQDVLSAVGVNLRLASTDGGELSCLLASRETLMGVLWVLCAAQATRQNVTKEDFCLAVGARLDDAAAALVQAVDDCYLPDGETEVVRVNASSKAMADILDRSTQTSFDFTVRPKKPRGKGRARRTS